MGGAQGLGVVEDGGMEGGGDDDGGDGDLGRDRGRRERQGDRRFCADKCGEGEQLVVLGGEERRVEGVGGAAGDEDKVDGGGLGAERVDDVVQRAVARAQDDGERRLRRQTRGNDLTCMFCRGGLYALAVELDVVGEEGWGGPVAADGVNDDERHAIRLSI